MKFKIGDKVRFKSPDSQNAEYFDEGLENLTIKEVTSRGYQVWESDKHTNWFVEEKELEFMDKHKLKVPTHIVIWDEKDRDPTRLFTSEKEANDFIKELSEKSSVVKNSILLVGIKSCKKIVIEKRLRYKEHKI